MNINDNKEAILTWITLLGVLFCSEEWQLIDTRPADRDPIPVTFNLNTASAPGWICEEPSILLRGDFNNWDESGWVMEHLSGEYWQLESPQLIAPGSWHYQYGWQEGNNTQWEDLGLRPLNLSPDDEFLEMPLDYFNTLDPPLELTEELDVLFRVATHGIPGYQEEVMYLVGSFTNWGTNPIELVDQFGDGRMWAATIHFAQPLHIEYKFWWGWEGWEMNENRSADVTADATLGFVFWQDLPVMGCSDNPELKNVEFQVDLSAWLTDVPGSLPLFSPGRNDEIHVLGAFNGWEGALPEYSLMTRQPGSNTFTTNQSIFNWIVIEIEYRFAIRFSEESRLVLENQYGSLPDQEFFMECPPSRGGLPRWFTLSEAGDSNDLQLPLVHYADLHPSGIIPAANEIELSFSVDMSTAPGFLPGDAVALRLGGIWQNILQGFPLYSGTDSRWPATALNGQLYQVTIPLTGPAAWSVLYRWEYVNAAGQSILEGDADEDDYRVRYICPVEGLWADTDFPDDMGMGNVLLPVEDLGDGLACADVCACDGDLNRDGDTNVVDVVLMVGHILEEYPLPEYLWCHADMDGNADLDVLDIVGLIEFILNGE